MSRGIHLITSHIHQHLPELPASGLLNIFIQHTSAGICINENADPDVRLDFEKFMDKIVPENMPFVIHTAEGPDDMPAHVKASMVGTSVTIPIIDGRLALGTWQGIYLCEFRDAPRSRKIILSIYA
ncbi:MAG: secondary thiamine-phosphate synthase enzyme YjbQ [Saprospiraceae bacterium]|nr:secondary thiamine-phosphate synthase enzyme YjbQ [Saprospiraceae bacterium]